RLRLGIVAEHAASMKPHAVTAMTRLMIQHHLGGKGGRLSPEHDHRGCRVTWRLPALIWLAASNTSECGADMPRILVSFVHSAFSSPARPRTELADAGLS